MKSEVLLTFAYLMLGVRSNAVGRPPESAIANRSIHTALHKQRWFVTVLVVESSFIAAN
jgi:hypothetical protein